MSVGTIKPMALSHLSQECLSLVISRRCHSALYCARSATSYQRYPTVSLARVQVRWRHSRCRPFWALRARGSPRSHSILPDLDSSLMVQGLSRRLAPSTASTHPGGVLSARRSLIATGASVAAHALDTRVTGLPGRASWWCRAPPAHSAHRALAAPCETVCGDPVHHRPSPSRGAPDPPTGRASPGTDRAACDTAPPAARGMLGVVAHPEPSPGEETSGSRA